MQDFPGKESATSNSVVSCPRRMDLCGFRWLRCSDD